MIPVRPRSINTFITGEQPKLFYNPQHPPPSNPRTASISPSDITVEQKRMESLDQYKSVGNLLVELEIMKLERSFQILLLIES